MRGVIIPMRRAGAALAVAVRMRWECGGTLSGVVGKGRAFRRLPLLALVTSLAEPSWAAQAPAITMHRSAACEPIEGGWCRAKSTLGAFVVDMPTSFNDFSLPSEPLQTGGRGRAHVVEGVQQGISITVICIEYTEGKPSPGLLLDGIARGATSSSALIRQGVRGRRFDIQEPGSRLIGSAYEGGSFVCIQSMSGAGDRALPAADQQRFFDSISLPP